MTHLRNVRTFRTWALVVTAVSSAAVAGMAACTSDDATTAQTTDGGPAVQSDAAPQADGSAPADAGAPSDGGGSELTFTVPAGGGSYDVQGTSMKLTFSFPASAAGKTISFAKATAQDIGWPAGQFAEAIRLGPDGERFADPILVVPEKKELVSALFSFGDAPTKTAASPVPLKADGSGFELRHFSTLVVVTAGRTCDSVGYNDTANDPYCSGTGDGRTTMRVTTCKGFSYCLNTSLKCCVTPGDDAGGCTWADAPLQGTQTPTDSNGGQFPYCNGDAGDWDGGASGCLSSGLAYAFQGASGCYVQRSECNNDNYVLGCDGGTCTCAITGASPSTGGTFPQGNTCDHAAAMRTTFVQRCNYPASL